MRRKTYTRTMVGQRSAAQIQHAVRSTIIMERDGQMLTLGDHAAALNNDGLAWALQESIKKLIAAHKYGTDASLSRERETFETILGATVSETSALTMEDIPRAAQRIDAAIAQAIEPAIQQHDRSRGGRG